MSTAGHRCAIVAVFGSVLLGACAGDAPPVRRVTPVTRDVMPALRGTIGAEATINGVQPTLVSGFGLVVGLNGTGGQVLNERIAATMERQMALNKISTALDAGADSPISHKSPRDLLRDPNIAVVLVQALVPPGAPKDSMFDVYVSAQNASSLEGGRLWTTDLRIGPANVFGAQQARQLGYARGPVFVNPFSEPGKEAAGVNEKAGRVLAGGVVSEPLQLELALDQQSFTRARQVTGAINSRFPEGRGDRGPIAHGRSGGNVKAGSGGRVAVNVPAAYRHKAGEFVRLLQAVQVDQSYQEEYARRYMKAMTDEPRLAEELSYCLEALGPRSLPFLRELYEHPEIVIQMSALRAGVGLGDARATPQLQDLAANGPSALRATAVALLGEAKAGPTADVALQRLLLEDELLVRVGAYEALARRAEREQFARVMERVQSSPGGDESISATWLEDRAALSFSGSTLQGVERTPVYDGAGGRLKFLLDVVPFGDPLVYITQQGTPRIVVFGENPSLVKPLLVSAWSDRLLMASDSPTDQVRVSYRSVSGKAVNQVVPETLIALIGFMAHRPTPEDPRPGLAMSYSEVVGALYAIFQAGGTTAAFATERDRLLAELMQSARAPQLQERPESGTDTEELVVFERAKPEPVPKEATKPQVRPIPAKAPGGS